MRAHNYDQIMTLSTIFSELLIPWQPKLVRWYIIISQSVLWKKIGLLHSGSRSQWRVWMFMFVQMISSKLTSILFPKFVLWCIIMQKLIWPTYDNFYCIFWTANPFATKFAMIVHYHKWKCFMEKLDCCVQGQGHRKVSKCQWMTVRMIPSEMLNLLLPNLVWWCIIMSQIVFQKHWFAVFKVKVTVKDSMIKMWLF